MHGRIAKLAECFLTQDVQHSKRALASPRRNLRLRAVGFSKAMDVRHTGRIMALVIPSERSTQGRSQCEESSHRDVRGWTSVAEQDRTRVLDPWTGPPQLSGIAQTSWRGTSLRSAWQRKFSLWKSAGLTRMPMMISPKQPSGRLPRPYDLPCAQIRKSDDLDNDGAKSRF